jgi:hypothetical protein
MDVFEEYQHPAWVTAVGTLISYGLVLGLMFVLLFVVPFLLFWQVF